MRAARSGQARGLGSLRHGHHRHSDAADRHGRSRDSSGSVCASPRGPVDGPAALVGYRPRIRPHFVRSGPDRRRPAGTAGHYLSRLAELAVAASSGVEWPSIGHLAARLALDAAARQNATGAAAELRGSCDVFVETPSSGKRSLERILVGAKAVVRNGALQSVTGSATVTIMSACPCTLTYTKYDRASWLATRLADFEVANESLTLPSYTHSQRANATAFVETSTPSDCLHVLLDALNSTCRLTRTVLKRPDEHSVVRDSHSRPQFTEDIARSIVASVCERAQGELTEDGVLAVGGSCRAIESIHGHDAYASAIRRFDRES